MNEWLNRCHIGDCIDTMRRMPDGIVQTCVTSPPYFNLRDYGHAGQIGLEPTPAEFVAKLVEVFREVRRVLRDDGTLWLNLGDSYGAIGGNTHAGFNERYSGTGGAGSKQDSMLDGMAGHKIDTGLRPKNLIGIPWRVAFALQADGWFLRQDIIWHKPNPMPESVRDRCTKAHEYIFLLSKSESYYYDIDAVREPFADASIERLRQDIANQKVSDRVPGKTNGPMKAVGLNDNRSSYRAGSSSNMNDGEHVSKSDAGLPLNEAGRNKRSVWTVATTPYSGAHFATFPPALIEPCILAGAPAGGVVLDPFFGSGTTGQVAQDLGRQWIGCELNPAYVALQTERTAQMGLELA